MKIRGATGASTRIDVQMAPMIDVVFLLLIFFMLTLKIIAPEGDFNINMPIGVPSQADDPLQLPDIKVKLVSDADGNLTQLLFGSRNLGNDEQAFERLNSEILRVIVRPNNPLTKEVEVEIDADYELKYEYVVKTISACTGRLDPEGNLVRYIEKIKFAPPHAPKI